MPGYSWVFLGFPGRVPYLHVFVLVPQVLCNELHSLRGPVGLWAEEGVRQVGVPPAPRGGPRVVGHPTWTPRTPRWSIGPTWPTWVGVVGMMGMVGVMRVRGHVVQGRPVVHVLHLVVEAPLPALAQLARGVVQVRQLHDFCNMFGHV